MLKLTNACRVRLQQHHVLNCFNFVHNLSFGQRAAANPGCRRQHSDQSAVIRTNGCRFYKLCIVPWTHWHYYIVHSLRQVFAAIRRDVRGGGECRPLLLNYLYSGGACDDASGDRERARQSCWSTTKTLNCELSSVESAKWHMQILDLGVTHLAHVPLL